jgi:hypothetical protein
VIPSQATIPSHAAKELGMNPAMKGSAALFGVTL